MRALWQPHGTEPQVWAYGSRRRMDVGARAMFPEVSRRRLALQIRQDLWRQLQGVRGLSPVVAISQTPGELDVTAGCQLDGMAPRARIEDQIAELMADPTRRRRWITYAQRRGVPARARGAALA